MEIGQLQDACDLLREYEGVEPEEILPPALPDTPVTFEPNKEYVREILASQYDLRTDGFDYVASTTCPPTTATSSTRRCERRRCTERAVVIDETARERDREYRDETEGDNPIAELRQSAQTELRSRTCPPHAHQGDGAVTKPIADRLRRARPSRTPTSLETMFAGLRPERAVHGRAAQRDARPTNAVAGTSTDRARDATNNPVLQAKYREFGEETERHVEILEALHRRSGRQSRTT